MPLRFEEWITTIMMYNEEKTLFVFGDNMHRYGKGGQASVMRDKPNSIGIPTKHYPSMKENAFFSDEDYDYAIKEIDWEFDKLEKHLRKGGTVVWPKAGIGTERAQLKERAPKIFKHIQNRLRKLQEI